MKTTRSMLMVVMTMAVMIGSASAALITGTTIQSATTGLNPDMGPEKAINGVGLPGDTPALSGSHIQSHSTNWWTGWSGAVTDWQITVDLEGNFALDTIHVWNYREGGTLNNRGLRNVEIYVSPDEDENNLVKLNTNGSGTQDNGSGDFLFPVAPGTSEYLGFDLDTSGVTNASLLDNARLVRLDGGPDNHDGGSSWGGLAEIQFGGDAPGTVDIPVPNGDFAVYKPETGYTVRGTAPNDIWVQQIGDNRPLSSGTPVDFDDGTSGMVVDIPGWITPRDSQGSPTGAADLFTLGYDPSDGTSTLNAFGAWSGQNGNLAESAAPLDLPANRASMTFELSAMVIGDVGARTFDLLVDGVALTPDSSVEPSYDPDIWQEMSRTYNGIPAGDVTILVGTARPGDGDPDLFGSRMRVDNISLTGVANAVPEPSTFALASLGLLGLAFFARRRT